jgi:hypothetical protein
LIQYRVLVGWLGDNILLLGKNNMYTSQKGKYQRCRKRFKVCHQPSGILPLCSKDTPVRKRTLAYMSLEDAMPQMYCGIEIEDEAQVGLIFGDTHPRFNAFICRF